MAKNRRTQAERREETRRVVLESAIRLFGEKGYAGTSLDDVAKDCGLTTRPVYHYFGNKEGLFREALEATEERIVEHMQANPGASVVEGWHHYLEFCKDPAFRRIVLIDGPNVLGRARWADSAVTRNAKVAGAAVEDQSNSGKFRSELRNRMLMGALAEAALMVAEADDLDMAQVESEALIKEMFDA